MEYHAIFKIDCGVSHSHGIKYPENLEKTETFDAESFQVAYTVAINLAGKFADSYLSNPETGLTTVRLLSLRDSNGEIPLSHLKTVVQGKSLESLSLT